jgi:GT2 family glycosyltransferase
MGHWRRSETLGQSTPGVQVDDCKETDLDLSLSVFPELAIIIVNFNLKIDTGSCIRSFLESGAVLDQILIMDNRSTDGSLEYLQAEFGPALNITVTQENRGYAYGLNEGIKWLSANRSQAEWYLLMNNDTLVDKAFLREFKKATEKTAFDLLGPLILYYDTPERIWYLGDRIVPGTLITTNPFRGKRGRDIQEVLSAEVLPVDMLNGCSMLVNKKVFEKIGLFEEHNGMYAEEVDFVWRARLAKFQLAAVPAARMWHKISASAKKQKGQTRYQRIRNQIFFYRRYSRLFQLPLMFFFSLSRCIGIGISDCIKKQPDLIRPLIRGWVDGWFGNYA